MKYISILFILGLISCKNKSPEITGFEGKPMPSFTLLLTDSSTVFDTGKIPTGSPIVFFLFSPQCPYSKKQMEEIIENMNELKNIHFYIFSSYHFASMKQFATNFKLKKYENITVGLDIKDFFGDYMGARGVPYIAIYDQNKLLSNAFVGETSAKLIKSISKK